MPKPQPIIRCRHFSWRLYTRDGVWYADGRSDARRPGRHSLNTRDRKEAEENIVQLDHSRAVDLGLVNATNRPQPVGATLALDAGRKLYEEHLDRPRIAGGVRASTKKRYRTVFDKFIEFAKTIGVSNWNEVSSRTLTKYAAHLENQDYRSKTLRNELTTLGQAVRCAGAAETPSCYFSDCLSVCSAVALRTSCQFEKRGQLAEHGVVVGAARLGEVFDAPYLSAIVFNDDKRVLLPVKAPSNKSRCFTRSDCSFMELPSWRVNS